MTKEEQDKKDAEAYEEKTSSKTLAREEYSGYDLIKAFLAGRKGYIKADNAVAAFKETLKSMKCECILGVEMSCHLEKFKKEIELNNK